jgi:hypothetical protein
MIQNKRQVQPPKKIKAHSSERDWPTPHPVSAEFFLRLCREHDVLKKDALQLKLFLDELVHYLRIFRADLLRNKSDSDVRRTLRRQITALYGVTEVLRPLAWLPGHKSTWQMLPPPGSNELSTASASRLPQLASPIFWTNKISGESPSALSNTSNPGSRSFLENMVRTQPTDVMNLILEELAGVLTATVAAMEPGSSGGQKRYVLAPFLLKNLAEAYHQLGREPAKSASGPFGRFASDVVDGIGWDTGWVRGQIGPAVDQWRRRRQKTASEEH